MNIFKIVDRANIELLVMESIKEDRAFTDITTQMCVPEEVEGVANIIAKENGVLSGIQIAEVVLQNFGVYVVEYFAEDGENIKEGNRLAKVKGKLRGMLSAERTILNFIQHLSGIATYTQKFVKIVEKYNVKILDTRKTTPGLRTLEKYAVLCGGGINHRFDLYDQIMIKDNHLSFMKDDFTVIQRMKNKYPDKKIIVEVKDIEDIEKILNYPVDRILLDNMTPENVEKSIKLINGRCEIEISGNIDEKNIELYAQKYPDFISIGKITHSAKALDISMKVENV
ncbi:MAG: carboxylating nicotinate-nucleotide diphosphorylase [bacterium]|uniref:Probable nicotinate-nucleotide pyrophosphorylase [carboxylating] n=1 Tax=candidate division TA06 bacterium 34_109 TaxID=1635277 RepID=A0A101I1V4_UNCT6|nr:MAG: Nicotinate-nucleotide pyrophosphorylase [candidate division TA06 bacterium 32_111]KUK87256.1 MAG: Nicotinate-nucleotide pyrophosphorylase [candidate division TA06 bacterium 34_109]MDI6700486.1 carboxylating nicotinate-nucleotide diphosphorylase [bacterium]